MKLQQLARNVAAITLTWEETRGFWSISLPFLCLLHKQGYSPPCWAASQRSQALCFLCHFSCLLKSFLRSAPNFSECPVALPSPPSGWPKQSKPNYTSQTKCSVSGMTSSCHYQASFSSVLYLCTCSVTKVLRSLLFCDNINPIVSQELNKNLISGWNHKFNSAILITACCRSSSQSICFSPLENLRSQVASCLLLSVLGLVSMCSGCKAYKCWRHDKVVLVTSK